MNILLINNHSVLNAGDYAILQQTLRLLHTAFPQARISLSFNDVESARAALPHYPIHSAMLGWAVAEDASGRYALVSPLRRAWYVLALALGALIYRTTGRTPRLFADPQKQNLFAAFTAADLVLACGGGYLYASGPQGSPVGWFTFTLLSLITAILLRKPLVLLPQSIGPLHDSFQQQAVRWIVRHATLTCVRERYSLALLQRWNLVDRTLLIPDLAVGMPGAVHAQGEALLARFVPPGLDAAFRVGMTALNWSGQNHAFGGQTAYEQALLETIDALTEQGGVVVLFGQCCGPTPAEDDRIVSRRLREAARHPTRVFLVDVPLPPEELQAAYGCMDYFIGTRMHSVILALNAGVPALAIGYQHKTRGLLDEIGMTERCSDIANLSADNLLAAFEQLRAAPQQPRVNAYRAWAARAHAALGSILSGYLKSSRQGPKTLEQGSGVRGQGPE